MFETFPKVTAKNLSQNSHFILLVWRNGKHVKNRCMKNSREKVSVVIVSTHDFQLTVDGFWRITHFVKSVNILKKVNVNILNRIDKWKKSFCLQKILTQSIFPRNYLYCFSRDLDWDALGSKDIFVRFRIMFISKFYISLVREINITSFIECPFILNVITVTSLFYMCLRNLS